MNKKPKSISTVPNNDRWVIQKSNLVRHKLTTGRIGGKGDKFYLVDAYRSG